MKSIFALVVLVVMLATTFVATFRFGRNAGGRTYMSRLEKTNFKLAATLASADAKTVIDVSHPSYEKTDSFRIKEYGLDAILYKHKKSGAQVVSVMAPDENKVFGITFRTPPDDSTGVPHVLEHSVLCGSRKFPVKEPFVDLLKGSLQNFLNAFTYPDRTCYPVASTNTKDFYNLIHVYLDAVLHPRAIEDPQVLQQEGWHYELDDLSQPLTVKGVVYNEMKGVYSSPDSIMGRATQRALFPENTYRVDSGGDPKVIPDLTFDQFKDFHSSYYHPSNSRVFFYGDDDPLQRLQLLDEYLKDFDAIPVTSQIQFQKKFNEPKKLQLGFPVTPGTEPKHMITLNWLLNEERLDTKKSLALGVLDYLLLGTSSAALRKVLTESALGESVTGGGLSDELLQNTFSVGLKGVKETDAAKVEDLVMATLTKLVDTGFEANAIEAAMNTFEFRLREFNTGSFPKGLSVMLGMMSQWIYDGSPADGVQFEAPLARLKEDLAAGKPVFQDLIKEYLVSNNHRVTVEMKPDFEMESKRIAEEEKWLAETKASMSSEELAEVMEVSRRLREAQEAVDSPEAKATLPKLGLEDIDPLSKPLPIKVLDGPEAAEMDATIITHPLQTNGILYTEVAFDYAGVEVEDLELLPLFSRMLTETGTKEDDFTTLSRKIGANTGGIGISYHNDIKHSAGTVAEPNDCILKMMIRGKAVTDKVPTMFQLFSDILLNSQLDNQKRAVEMLRESKARKESMLLSSGHTYAATRISSKSSFLGYLNELTGGVTSVRAAGTLLEEATNNWPKMQARLERMRDSIIKTSKENMIVNLTGDEEMLQTVMPTVKSFLSQVPSATAEDLNKESVLKRWNSGGTSLTPVVNEGFTIPSQVNYVAKGGSIFKPGDKVKGSYAVASRYISTGYLWDQVRVLGGAYGGFARFSETTGRFLYLSYRDPNCINTLNVYDSTAEAISEGDLSSEEVLQAVIGTVGDLDSPMTPDQKGFSSMLQYMAGETDADIQQRRTDILNTSVEDFKEFANQLRALRESGTVVVFGAEQAIEQANSQLPEDKKMIVEQALNAPATGNNAD